jgi:hypothetical protein
MNYWSREDTKEWIAQLEDRIEDIEHYLNKAMLWCDQRDIDDERIIFMCCFLTCIWVSQLRCEEITYIELLEMLGVEVPDSKEEKFYELDDRFIGLTHVELLTMAVDSFNLKD